MSTIKSLLIINGDEAEAYQYREILYRSELVERVQVFHDSQDAFNYLKLIEEVNEYYRIFAPQIILLEVNMLFYHGFNFLEEFNKLIIFKKRPIDIFFLSEKVKGKDAENRLPVKDFKQVIQKPLDQDKLVGALQLSRENFNQHQTMHTG